jgi:hypothetical protein
LQELNPDFKGTIRRAINTEADGFMLVSFNTDGVTNISPIRAIPEVQNLRCDGSAPGRGRRTNLAPLRALQVKHLDCRNNPIVDFSPLKDTPLETIFCEFDANRDAAVFRSIKTLKRINGEPATKSLSK